ncbi:S-adenosyl-L-methionine-dependent methyltransferase [Mycena indigotica]|uniref:S-adenosyl-L-methionine-dependent methyltransferase n=1 Tax=Mycena indigotica TaxID=2126181 RepID=A0A8H6S4D4_9AGAR|nr:S-adenosyl-L-methionine-dependent methyltransferase [Mycena indigotica]KAF7292684.1 S-adenosyl-L-methionine-dependent methyltransferase [Mycena indigotica]
MAAAQEHIHYALPSVADSQSEIERLDMMHIAIRGYMHGRLSFAPLEEMDAPPQRILELGCGSGAWAIQAAEELPAAHVVAVDLSPFPDRPVPSNFEFIQLDITKELPFAPHSFDIVHSRFVFGHVAKPRETLARIASLVAPRGFLLLEDFDSESLLWTSPPAAARFTELYVAMYREHDQEPDIGRNLKQIMENLDGFGSPAHEHKAAVPLGVQLDDYNDAMRAFARGMRNTDIHAAGLLIARQGGNYGFTDDVLEAYLSAVNTADYAAIFDVYFCWARRTAL